MSEPQNKEPQSEQRKESRIIAAFPVQYCFVHAVETLTTKVFRKGKSHDVSLYGLSFEADIIDPSIIPSALRGEILVCVTLTLPDASSVQSMGRVAWVKPFNEESTRFLVGVEYTEASDEERMRIFESAQAYSKKS